MGKKQTIKIGRDAGTGEFISVEEAKRRPKTTIVETIKRTVKPPLVSLLPTASLAVRVTVVVVPATMLAERIETIDCGMPGLRSVILLAGVIAHNAASNIFNRLEPDARVARRRNPQERGGEGLIAQRGRRRSGLGRYASRLHRYLLVFTRGHEATAQELLQQTIIKVARNMRIFYSERELWNWLALLAHSASQAVLGW